MILLNWQTYSVVGSRALRPCVDRDLQGMIRGSCKYAGSVLRLPALLSSSFNGVRQVDEFPNFARKNDY